MAWYYYSGTTSRPIPVKKGVSIAAKPHSKIEIIDVNSKEVQILSQKGLLVRTGPPVKKGISVIDQIPMDGKKIAEVTPPSKMAAAIAEKGKTNDRKMPPEKIGKVEMTSGELSILKSASFSADDKDSIQLDLSTKVDASVEVLSEVDGSPVENKEGDEENKKKKNRK